MAKSKITKESIPEYTMGLVYVDLIPVVLFGINAILISILLNNYIMLVGSFLCLISGMIKVLWKGIVVKYKKNIWWMFIQMRIFMPLGFLLMGVALFFNNSAWNLWIGFLKNPCFIFYVLGILGMFAMGLCAFILDSKDLKLNWIEQGINGLSQLFILIGIIICFIIG